MKAASLGAPAALQRLFDRSHGQRSQAINRRVFLKVSGIGGLALGFACSDEAGPPEAATEAPTPPGDCSSADTAPGQAVAAVDVNAFVRIGEDDSITLYCMRSDMGQGVLTSLSMILAEELDVEWAKVRAEHPVAPAGAYDFGGINRFTAASASIAQTYSLLRQMGAAARQMLIAAAAEVWGVAPEACGTKLGEVVHDATGRRLRYAEVAERAATLVPPQDPPLKQAEAFRLIGTPRSQINALEKASGTAQYTLDVSVPNMLTAVISRAPSFGDTLIDFDDSAALAVPGVRGVVQIPSGVAVLADHFWAAVKGREALRVNWQPGPSAALNTSDMAGDFATMLSSGREQLPQTSVDAAPVIAEAVSSIDVQYDLPYLAHAALEPLNALAHVKGDGTAEVWAGTQAPEQTTAAVADLLGVPATNVVLHVPLLGGGFGRRLVPDYVLDAAAASRAAGNRPVKVIFTREDDMRAANYRPMNCSRIRASLGADGLPNAWIHELAVQRILPDPLGALLALEGATTNFPYAMPVRSVRWAEPQVAVPVFTWRSVGSSHNAFVVESSIDELAELAGADSLDFRLRMLEASAEPAASRHARALRVVAERAGWSEPVPSGRARGIAVHQTFGTIVAQVAEVSVEGQQVRVHRVWAAVDCGRVVNPSGVIAQCEGGIIFGISAALYGRIDIEQGRPVQSNYNDYRLLRHRDAPELDVTLVDPGSDAVPITGMGEPGVPPIAPAITSALFKLTGRRIRRLPIEVEV